MKKWFIFLLCVVTILIGSCDDKDPDYFDPDQELTDDTDYSDWDDPEIPADSGDPGDAELIPNTQQVAYENMISIAFSGSGVSIDNPFADSGVTVESENGHVVITSSVTDEELNYVLSGIVSDGSVKIYGNYKFGLVLNGVGITNPNGAAINIQCGKKVTVTVQDGTNNRLIDGEEYQYVEGEDMKATFFSEGQLNFYGNGTLEVRGKTKHGICSDDYIRIYEGNIWIKEAASDAVHANDYVRIDGGTLTTRSAGEGIECEKGYVRIEGGTIEIVTTGQKGHGIKSKEYITINSDGTINITVYGNASKGLNASEDITITKGKLTIQTAGDAIWESDEADTSSCAGIKCDGDMLIEYCDLTILSTGSGGKGINVTGDLVIHDGIITVTTTGDQYVYDRNNDTAAKAIRSKGDLTIHGGIFTIRTSKTEAEGIESKATLTITGGELDIRAYDNCLNAGTHIQIDGGTIYCLSATNDGIDSNGTLTITGGLIVSAGAGAPEAGIDCDQSRFTITSGTIIGIGGDTSTPTASACTQHSVVFKTSGTSNTSGSRMIRIESTSGGKDILTFKAPRSYSTMTLLFSSPLLEANTDYTIYTGGSVSGGTEFYGYYTDATYTDGTSAGTFTTSSMVSNVGSSGSNRPR
ncbi:MAG: carbohydrate-binding domain-containing protein [Parabacteroides sp.]|nr:carbohydrate-binding domain-containing protein [Parabacteroides sp.]